LIGVDGLKAGDGGLQAVHGIVLRDMWQGWFITGAHGEQ
jgi:hypothetical protein